MRNSESCAHFVRSKGQQPTQTCLKFESININGRYFGHSCRCCCCCSCMFAFLFFLSHFVRLREFSSTVFTSHSQCSSILRNCCSDFYNCIHYFALHREYSEINKMIQMMYTQNASIYNWQKNIHHKWIAVVECSSFLRCNSMESIICLHKTALFVSEHNCLYFSRSRF